MAKERISYRANWLRLFKRAGTAALTVLACLVGLTICVFAALGFVKAVAMVIAIGWPAVLWIALVGAGGSINREAAEARKKRRSRTGRSCRPAGLKGVTRYAEERLLSTSAVRLQ